MKNLKNIKLLSFLFILGMIAISCVQDDDYSIPEINVQEPTVGDKIELASVMAMYGGFDPVEIEAGDGSGRDIYIEVYVVSSDESGNFYKTLVVQNAPENPTVGVSISTNSTDLYTKFEPGRKIYFRVNNLFIGEYAGLPTIGVQDGDEIGRIDALEFEKRIFRSLESAELVPTVITISQASNPARLNTLVKFENVQFPADIAGVESYANPDNTFGVNRPVENCDGQTVLLRTSGFSDFKALTLPTGNGSLTAVLSIFNSDYQLFIRDVDDVNMQGERCESTEIDCGLATTTGNNVLFSDDFESQTAGNPITGNGWTNYVEAGSETWEAYTASGNNPSLGVSARMQAYNSGDDSNIAWLITPLFNFDAQNGETLNFQTSNSFSDGSTLELLFSSNWDGNPANITSATWDMLPAAYITQDSDPFGSWFPSGNVSLDCITGSGYIALKYVGSGQTGFDGTYEFDEIVVNSN